MAENKTSSNYGGGGVGGGGRGRRLAWGIFYKNEYKAKGNPRDDLRLTKDDRKIIASRMKGKPFMLGHSKKKADTLGSIKQAFVSDSGDLHALMEFSHENFHSVLVNELVSTGKIRGLSLTSIANVDKNLNMYSTNEPVEGSLVPLSKARRGEDCEIYKLGDKWLCEDSKRTEYNSVLLKAGVVQPKNQIKHFSSMETSEQQQNTSSSSTTDNNNNNNTSTTSEVRNTNSQKRPHEEVDLVKDLQELNTLYQEQQKVLKKYQENEQIKRQMEDEDKIEKAKSWLDSSVNFIQQLIKEGLSPKDAEQMINSCAKAVKERNIPKLDELSPMMQVIHSSHVHSMDVETRYKEQVAQTKKVQDERNKFLDEQKKLKMEFSKFSQQRKQSEDNYKRHGINSRVDTSSFTTQSQNESPYHHSTSFQSGYDSHVQEKKQKQNHQQHKNDQRAHFEAGTVHKNVSTDKVLNPTKEASIFAPKPRLTSKLRAMAHHSKGLGIPEAGGMKQYDPERYDKMVNEYRSNGYIGHTAFENSAFCGKTYYGGDIPDNSFTFNSKQAPVPGDMM